MDQLANARSPEFEEPSAIGALAPTALPLYRPRVLKHADTFLVLDHFGDAQVLGPTAEGVFHEDTRHLSSLSLRVDGQRPLLLGSRVSEDNALLAIDLTAPDLENGPTGLPRDTVHIRRTKVLGRGVCHERIEMRNHGVADARFRLDLLFDADFADLFEVRGHRRPRRGRILPPVVTDDGVVLAYRGLDDVERRTRIAFAPKPVALRADAASFDVALPPGGTETVSIAVKCERGAGDQARDHGYDGWLAINRGWAQRRRSEVADIHTSNEVFNDWINRSRADIDMLITETSDGYYPYAGSPWFSTAFGRDGLITALQCLWLDPMLARGVLKFLATRQATTVDVMSDAEPGKILHETRKGEMAALGEVPFGLYYGTVDATPLFVMLAAGYLERTGDLDLLLELWPRIEAALDWMATYGDVDGDGFLEYERKRANGLFNQGWKDSDDGVSHRDGRLAVPPTSLVEVQGYAYAAYRGAATVARALGERSRAESLDRQANALRERFEAAFWCEEIDTYALALDGAKQPCRVRSSNAGHALFTGIATPEHATRVAATLLGPSSFSGWGIRTLAEGEARYNPMSYHNGSVWPHDNGLIALGLARYDLRDPLVRLLGGLFDAALLMDQKRLPELFCGFARLPGEEPTAYPVACTPQAWSSAAVFAVLGAMLGVSFRPDLRQIRFVRPVMPPWLDEMRLDNLRLGEASVDLLFRRHKNDVSVNVVARTGDVEVALLS